jgi:hypothetical protein
MKTGLTPSVLPKISSGAQNMKTGPVALEPSKMSLGVQNMKMGPDALDTTKNMSRSAKHEIETDEK